MDHRRVSIRNRGDAYTKSAFLCAFALRNPSFRAFRAQNRGFCAFLAFRTPIFGHFEHKIEVFVRFWPSEPPFSALSSTKSAFLCALVGPRLGPRLGRRPGATGTTTGTVWVADILSQLGFVWTLALYLTWRVMSSVLFPGA